MYSIKYYTVLYYTLNECIRQKFQLEVLLDGLSLFLTFASCRCAWLCNTMVIRGYSQPHPSSPAAGRFFGRAQRSRVTAGSLSAAGQMA